MGIYNRNYPLTTIGGTLVIVIYCTFTLISWALYPDPYGPITHYLSRLGNFDYSPIGAYFYNWGCILTGIAMFPFFFGLRVWYTKNVVQGVILFLGLILGIASGGALMAIGFYSEDQGAPHMDASRTFFIMLFVVLLLVIIALLLNPHFNKLVGLYGLAMTFSSLYFALTVDGTLTEWYSVFGSLVFVGLVSWNTMKKWEFLK
ncbi:MAG: DUF998 domain-containing protein [Candidatus Thorarchaeota archaeon]